MPLPRILMLPGYTQNASIFSGRVGALRRALKDSAELIFVDPPHVVEMPTNSSEDFSKFDSSTSTAAGSTAPEDIPRAWWFGRPSPEDGVMREYTKLDEAIVYLRELIEKHQPTAVFGFSQGAAAAAILTALVEDVSLDPVFSAPPKDPSVQWPPKPFDFAILSAGFLPLDPRTLAYFATKPKTPTLHVLGRGDTIVGPERSVPLTEAFEDSRVEWHSGGHHTPSKASWRRFFQAYIECFGDGGKGVEGVEEVPSPTTGGSEEAGELANGRL
ncbi:alpha/beta hydrolase [Sporobolomyces salmoneus]|uniref:alpha/beta hydrolase n=1 Tax=Sporobolomyces salmoneus TaxID=183962 RepID=UPI0031821C40